MSIHPIRRIFTFCFFLILNLLVVGTVLADVSANPEKVHLQLKWFNQFQFAGYYAAIEKGYFAEEGLEVEILERVLEKNFVKQVSSGETEYGVGDSGLLSQYASGEQISALAAIFQHNPLVFMSRQDSGIISPYEMVGKRIMSDIISTNEAPLRAMLENANISEKDYILLPQSNDYDLLTNNKVDVISGYLTDQPFYFKQIGLKINIINPQNYGIDFYGDILFTSRKELNEHPGRADRFLRAALRGWRYALDHPDEIIEVIHSKYHSKLSLEHLHFEAAETRKLILPDLIPLGLIEPNRLKMVADAYTASGLNNSLTENELNNFIYKSQRDNLNLTDAERNWLISHPVIKIGVDQAFAPYEWIDSQGEYRGLAADYVKLIEKKLGVRFEIIHDDSWTNILEMAKHHQLDMLDCAVKTPERSEYLHFTDPYKTSYAIIIDNGQGSFIGSLQNLDGKRIAIEKGYFMQEMLSKYHPRIKLVVTNDTYSALHSVLDGKADAYVGDAGIANYAIKNGGFYTLRFSGQTDYISQHGFAITKNNPELIAIIQKAMISIPKDQLETIFNHWSGLTIEPEISSTTLIKYGSALILLFLLFSYWVYRLRLEISSRKAAEIREQHRSFTMELLAQRAPLPEVLESIVHSVEQEDPTRLCSILLLDTTEKYLVQGASPSLPDFFNEAIDGLPVSDAVCSCSTAAFRGHRVITENIQQHPYWATLRDLAKNANLASCWAEPIKGSDGKVLGVIAIYRRETATPSLNDIMSIERAGNLAGIAIETNNNAEILRQSERKYRELFNVAHDAVTMTDLSGFLDCNQAALDLFGYSSVEEFCCKHPAEVSPTMQQDGTDSWKASIATMTTAINNGYMCFEWLHQRRDGSIFPAEVSLSRVSLDGKIVLQSVIRDLSERKRIEHALIEAKDKAEALAKSKSEFLANMSHEIRTPMNAILGLSHLALNKVLAPDIRGYLEKINQSSHSLLSILKDILDASKLEAGRIALDQCAFDLDVVLKNINNLFIHRAEEKALDFKIELDTNVPKLLIGDALRIQQILSNLLSNAIKFTDLGSVSLQIKLLQRERSRAKLLFSITDTGIGMSNKDREKIFLPFTQVDGANTRRFGGIGLGLSISHDLLQLMGSEIAIQSTPGQGSRFAFELILGISSYANHDAHKQPANSTMNIFISNIHPLLVGKKLLIVETNLDQQQIIHELLSLSDAAITIVNHGKKALKMLREQHYDLVML